MLWGDRQNTNLLDVLPCRGRSAGDAWRSREYELDPVLAAALADSARTRSINPSRLLCAALVLVESHITGADLVLATGSGEKGVAQCPIEVPATGSRDAWLETCAHALGNAVGAPMPGAWLVWTEEQPPIHSGVASAMTWQLRLSGHAQLNVGFRSPLDPESIDLLAGCALRVLATLASAADCALESIDILDPAERHRILIEWNADEVTHNPRHTVHALFADVARRHPQRCAVASNDESLTYGELDDRSDRVAAALNARGIGAGAIVALLLDRSAEAIVALLGILKAGAAYLPLDSAYPPERLALLLADAQAHLAICPRDYRPAALPSTDFVTIEDLQSGEASFAAPLVDGNALAYVMYTSGSTGTPKGVEIEHRSIIRLVRNVNYVEFGEAPRVLHAAPLGFDASTFEIWGALLNGGTLVIHSEIIPTGAGLADTIARHGVQMAWLTASLFNAIVDEESRHLAELRQLLIGGEALSVPHVRRALAALTDTRIINGYGPTECTTFAATYRIPRDLSPDARTIPIGRPIANTTLYVLNARGEPVPAGVTGELHIGGSGVARGYLNRRGLTAERFVPNPFEASDAKLYRTGDLVRWLPEGVIEFIGRADNQVKIRGHRIEIGEIEVALKSHPAVRAVAVVAREEQPGRKRLVAYYVESKPVAPKVLRAMLARKLPDFMVPALYVRLDALPVTANGKLDRNALPAPDTRRPELAATYAVPINASEQRVCELFVDLVGIDRVGRDDNFFELGGDSLLAVKAVAALDGADKTFSVVDFFLDPTPAAIAKVLEHGAHRAIAASRMIRGGHTAASEPVAIIAMAGRFPGAGDVETFWRNLCYGKESITFFRPDELDPGIPLEQRDDPAYVRARGVIEGVENFDAAFFGITPREAELMDPQQRIFLELCWECLERGGYVPDANNVPVGVFGGMYSATYFQHHVSAHPELVAKLGAFQTMLGNEKDYIAARVAHRLNLTGPAVNVQTACSTSLVAICQAFDALRSGQCDMALAGGASITCPPRSGYLYQEGAMLSPDGHTRTFAADAQGTIFSDGAAVVLLKRLSEALGDGDPIHAVIRGAAVNNDGAMKASFTAPSSAGQSAVIEMALDNAGVDARSISYVEAHGTATPLGDPIEIEGLTTAFRRTTAENGFCAIGSLKSNVGHLVIAAGAAGVIKTALALQEHQLPPSLHASATNPEINFANSPFVVNDRLIEWRSDKGPLRAGVSSFGVGGTNAHVILEQPPARASSDAAIGPQLLPLSARSAETLKTVARQLGDHLAEHPDSNLADVAYTLAVGRKVFAHRTHVVAGNVEDAVAQLRRENFPPSMAPAVGAAAPEYVFMFPGQGAQYAGMGRELYAVEPVFRDALDRCAKILRDADGLDLLRHMFDDDAGALRETAVTQPAIFAIEYALAQLWISMGVCPVTMIGHSVGEFTAAVIANVMSLADGLRLVARRGQLMQAQSAGAMLAVRLDAQQLGARLPDTLSLAAENSPDNCVVSGETAAIEAFRKQMEHAGIACRMLHTSHAFHSPMMDPVLAPLRAEVDRVKLAAPSIPIASTLTGTTLGDADAMSPDYWTRHARGTVRFSAALQGLLDLPQRVFLEVGPRTTLSMLARQQPAIRSRIMLATLADSPGSEHTAWLGAVGELWRRGAPLTIDALDRRTHKQRVRLPTYPFERKRHWVDAVASPNAARPAPSGAMSAANDPMPVATVQVPIPESPMVANPSRTSPDVSRGARVLAQLKGVFEDVAGADLADADQTAHFIEFGLDSLSLTQVALQLQKTFGLKITFRELMESCSTLERLGARIDRELPPDSVVATPAVALAAASTASTVAGLASHAGAGADPSLLRQVIEQQMRIMQQQLAMLGGAPAEAGTVQALPTPALPAPRADAIAAPSSGDPVPASTSSADEEAALAHKTYDVKKAFGAIARIHSGQQEITARQRVRLQALIRRYVARTQKSKDYTSQHRPRMADPRVVNSFRPLLKEIVYQIVVERSKGSRLWDIDGNEYVDALNGFGMNLFGWQPDFVLDAVRRQLDLGYEIGPQHPLAGEVADLVCELTGFDRAAFCNTGSEAVMGTVRIARTVTGRETLVIFSGSYHGIFDEVIVRGTRTLRSVPAAPGILRNTAEHVLVLDYGTPESLAIIKERAHEIAAVLVEPVQSRRPDLQPREFLKELRTITKDAGALLIFDEVVTGFRTHPRGAQHVLGVDADLASYGKVIGGGFPIGVIAGRSDYMDALDGGQWQFGDDSIPTVGVTYFAGTFVRHPLALAAAKAVLQHLKEAGPALQERLNARTAVMSDEMNDFCAGIGAPIKVTHFCSVWKISFPEDHPLQDLLFAMMRSRGIHILDNFPCFFTTAHSEADFAAITKAFKDSVLELQEAEFLPRHKRVENIAFDAAKPPAPGARLGKDADGRPAWFVPSLDAPGKFMKVKA